MRPIPFVLLTLMLTGWGLWAVQQRTQALRHGYAVQALEQERRKLIDENRKLTCEVAGLVRPERIAREVQRLGLPLEDPAARSRPGERQATRTHPSR